MKIFIILCFLTTNLYGQPSSSIMFVFKLYDKGQRVDLDKFCKEWAIVNANGGFISPCDKYAVGSSYDTSLNYFNIHVGAIYPPYIFSLIHQQDTMTIFMPTGNYFICDSLTIHDGTFLFDFSCADNERIKLKHFLGVSFCRLKNIDWILQRQKFKNAIDDKND